MLYEHTPKIISGNDLRKSLSEIASGAKSLTIISAYIKEPAVDWLASHVSPDCAVVLVGRLKPHDFIGGGSDIAALITSLSKGWVVKYLETLHAKIYLCDRKKLFIGSSNLTPSGLNIFGGGNTEACVELPSDPDNINFVEDIVLEAKLVTIEEVKKMEKYIHLNSGKIPKTTISNNWPEDILPREQSIWTYDFPWVNLNELNDPLEHDRKHDMDMLGTIDLTDDAAVSLLLKNTKAFSWLVKTLEKSKSKELPFGTLTEVLHNDLKDDPVAYRKDVKSLLSNLLSYCQFHSQKLVKIEKPKHRQIVKLVRIN